ncbi:MAG: hypothetical protein R2932_26670 [Caldilineaceae bacterium]
MSKKNIAKFVIAVALTLAVTFGSMALDVEVGLLNIPAVHACGNAGGGGGC